MELLLPTFRDVLLARRRVAPYLTPTPLIRPAALSRALGMDLYLKLENLQPIGAFKVRGGLNLVAAELDDLRGRRLFAASTGNHGLSVAYAARTFGLPASIYAPEGANPLKVASMEALGAEVVLIGRDFDAAREACEAAARRDGGRYIHSMNEPLLVAGVATLYLEALEAVPDADVLIVPVGGGSGLSGAGLVAKSLDPQIRVVGVQAEGAPAFYRSFRSGRTESTQRADTRAEGLATRQAFDLPLSMAKRYVDEMVLVQDAEMEEAMRQILETAHVVAEMAGAAAVAAAMSQRHELAGKRVICPISGGNATLQQLRGLF
ncbi:MAG: pyridoxal-phosphate dependent enzyme [Thermaerobacter sp.]|nr:pyridoxal-phosphate dependent enzyme [Thermaerobacter sp.]